MAAGSAPDASGGRRLFLLRGDDRASRPLARAPGQAGRQRRGPVLLVDGGRLAGLAWLEGDDDRSFSVRAALWTGQRWQAPERVSFPGPGSQLALTGAVLADGSWLLAWSAFDGHDDEIVWSRRAGSAWQPVKRLYPDNSVPDITPALAATADGGALIAWSRFDGHGYALRMARFPRRRRPLARRARRRPRPARSTPPSSAAREAPLSGRRAPRLVGARPRRRGAGQSQGVGRLGARPPGRPLRGRPGADALAGRESERRRPLERVP